MKIIIAGVGKVGSTLTRQLSASGYDITLIDVKQQVLEANVEKYDVMAVFGKLCHYGDIASGRCKQCGSF